jgi:hypothetical protein
MFIANAWKAIEIDEIKMSQRKTTEVKTLELNKRNT